MYWRLLSTVAFYIRRVLYDGVLYDPYIPYCIVIVHYALALAQFGIIYKATLKGTFDMHICELYKATYVYKAATEIHHNKEICTFDT